MINFTINTKKGDNTFYTAIIEKENINAAGCQVLDNNKSPLQFILEQQEKTRKKAEIIADRIIEEIILQKSKQQKAQQFINQQNKDLQKLNSDLQQSLDSRTMTGLQRQASTQSLDFVIKRSISQNQITPPRQVMQKKSELVLQIENQIERNINDEQNNQRSFDNISQSSRLSPFAGSPKLNELRNLNKSRNQLSPDKKISLNKVLNNQEDRLDTDISQTSHQNQANGSSFDIKEYMKQAVLQGQATQVVKNPNSDMVEQTPAFNLSQKPNTITQFISTLSHIEEGQGGDSGKNQLSQQKKLDNLTPQSLQGSQRNSLNQGSQKQMLFNNQDSFSINNTLQQSPLPSRTSTSRLSIVKRNVERDKLKMAHAEVENKQSQFKKLNEKAKEDKILSSKSSIESNKLDQQKSKVKDQKPNAIKKSEKENGQNGSVQINDFISKINMMLQKSATINAQVEQSMQDSQKNLKQLDSFTNLIIRKQ